MRALLDHAGVAPTSHFTMLPHGRIHHLELPELPGAAAHPDAGDTPIVLLHGAGGGGANWYRMLGPLSESLGRRVLAPDLPGFGMSDPVTLESPLGTHTAGLLHEWLEALRIDRVILVGTSFGGLAALRFAEHYPARVERLVLLDTAGGGDEIPKVVRLAASLAIGPVLLLPSRRGTQWLLRRLMTHRRLPQAEEKRLIEYLYQSARRSGVRFMVRALRMFARGGRQAEQPNISDLVRMLTPTLIVWGRHDAFFPVQHATALRLRLPDARVVEIDAGHSPNWEDPAELARVMIEFFAEQLQKD